MPVSILDREAEARHEEQQQEREAERRYWLAMMKQRDRLEAEIKAIDAEIARHEKQLEIITRDTQQKIADLHGRKLRARQELIDAKSAKAHLLRLADPALIAQRDRLLNAINEAESNVNRLRDAMVNAQAVAVQAPEIIATYGDREKRIELAQQRAISTERSLLEAEQRLAELRGELAAVKRMTFDGTPAEPPE